MAAITAKHSEKRNAEIDPRSASGGNGIGYDTEECGRVANREVSRCRRRLNLMWPNAEVNGGRQAAVQRRRFKPRF